MFYTKTHIDILPKLYDSFKIRLTVQEMQVQSLGQEDPLEKEMATHSSILFFFFHLFHSSILAWEIPWREEAGRLQFMESTFHGVAKDPDMT